MSALNRLFVVAAFVVTIIAFEPAAMHATGSDLVLNTTPAAVHVGEPIAISAQFCGTGHLVTQVQTWHWYPNTKLPAIEIPVDVSALTISQTAGGFSFPLTPSEPEIGLGVRVSCDDGSSAGGIAQRVWVFGQFGDFFFLAPYGTVRGDAGATSTITARTMDCVEGSKADASLALGIPPTIVTGQSTVVDGVVELSLAIPAATPDGVYELSMSCPSVTGGVVGDTQPFIVGNGNSSTPDTGSPIMLLVLMAMASITSGYVAIRISRGRRRQPWCP